MIRPISGLKNRANTTGTDVLEITGMVFMLLHSIGRFTFLFVCKYSICNVLFNLVVCTHKYEVEWDNDDKIAEDVGGIDILILFIELLRVPKTPYACAHNKNSYEKFKNTWQGQFNYWFRSEAHVVL
jgi:hypothetical protein